MTLASNGQTAIIRTERGLTIVGTSITLYDVMDYLKAQYPPKLIREKLGLNDEQLHSALAYIETYRTEAETEYQECLKTAAEIRQYWEERNRERLATIADLEVRGRYCGGDPAAGWDVVNASEARGAGIGGGYDRRFGASGGYSPVCTIAGAEAADPVSGG